MLKSIFLSLVAIISLQAATTYNKSLSDGNSNLNYWSDTTNSNLTNHTLVGATEVFTLGSRYNIPNVPTPIKVSTNKLCSNDKTSLVSCSKSDSLEPRYTDDGLATSGESNLRTWYKATTPKSVNGVVDDPCPSLSNVGSVINWWANFPSLRCERIITTYTPKVNSTIYTNKVSSDIFANKLSSTTSTSSVVYANKIATTSTNSISVSGSGNFNSTTGYRISGSGNTIFIGGAHSDYGVTLTLNGTTISGGGNFNSTTGYRISGSGNTIFIGGAHSDYGVTLTLNGTTISGGGNFNSTTGYRISGSGNTIFIGGAHSDYGVTLTLNGTTTTTYTCPATYTDNGSNCKKTVTGSTTIYSCPSGYSDNGSNCKQTIQICPDASWTSATATTCSKVIQICPDASWTDNGTNCRKNVPEYKLFSTF